MSRLMPMPNSHRHASMEFRAFLDDVKERMDLVSDNSAYTAVDAVFQVFRRRLTPSEGIVFASVLPSVLAAIFIRDWDVGAPPLPFGSKGEMNREAQRVRQNHNLTPNDAIEATAWALWRYVNHRQFEIVLSKLPEEARAFWHVETEDPDEIARRLY
ncbi:MAG: DUF2267 domain-containing protein [Paracoccaceae bacterium]|nr:DUF2267 domain-containing protein [Paracoccaceae bacterium]